jgi:hypothetical protein
MLRPTRLAMAGQAHHVLQRGNNKQPVFFDDEACAYVCAGSAKWLRPRAAPCMAMR